MNTLMNMNTTEQMTMSSLEIAELTGKQHKHVLRDVRVMSEKLDSADLHYEHNRTEVICPQTKRVQQYVLSKKSTLLLVSGYSLEVRSIIIDYLEKLGQLDALINTLHDVDFDAGCDDLYIYAIREEESGRIKLGISKHPEKRIKQLQTANSQKLTLVCCRKAETYKEEKMIHDKNEHHHIRGEWFTEQALEEM